MPTTNGEPPYGRTSINQPNRKPVYIVNDSNHKPVMESDPWAYLAWHKSTGRYYIAPQQPRQYLGRELDEAIFRFRQWSQKTNHNPPSFTVQVGWNKKAEAAFDYPIPEIRNLTQADFWGHVRQVILGDPVEASRLIGIPEIARLASLPKPEPSLTLASLWTMYESQPNPPKRKWLLQGKPYWSEFCSLTDATTVAEIDVDGVNRFHDQVYDEGAAVKHKFGLVKSVLSYALKRGKDQEQIQRALTLCKMLVPPRGNAYDPQPISSDHFWQLVDAADMKLRTMLLLSLNAALYPSEVAAVEQSHVNLMKRTFVMIRGKTGCPRIAILWIETVEAIREYLKTEPHSSKPLFLSAVGKAFTGNQVSRKFRKIRQKAGVPESVQYAHIRDGAETAAAAAGTDQAKFLAGHRVSGMTDAYVKRSPNLVTDAVNAIKKHYFPSKKPNSTSK